MFVPTAPLTSVGSRRCPHRRHGVNLPNASNRQAIRPNGKFRDECLNREIFYTLTEAKVLIERWRRGYNAFRPHGSLGLPAARAGFRQYSRFQRLADSSTVAFRSQKCGLLETPFPDV